MPRGMTLIDVLVGITIIVIVFGGLFGAFRLSVNVVSSAKGEAGADALASSQMEYVRSLSYGNIGVSGGLPAGVLVAASTTVQSATTYAIQTGVQYVDDPADGVGALDQNGNPNDYKAVTITVSWRAPSGMRSVSAVSYVAPPGIESLH
jgi:type II secretory pathway pseudopilin PulG